MGVVKLEKMISWLLNFTNPKILNIRADFQRSYYALYSVESYLEIFRLIL